MPVHICGKSIVPILSISGLLVPTFQPNTTIYNNKYDFSGTCSRSETLVFDGTFESGNSVIKSPFNIVHVRSSRSSQYNSSQLAVSTISFENSDILTSYFLNMHSITLTHFFSNWCSQSGQLDCSYTFSQPSQFEFTHHSDNHDFVFFEIVQHDIIDASSAHNDIDS